MRLSLVSLLVFDLSSQRFGIAASDVKEIVRAIETVRLPGAPAAIEGVINLRGAAIPLFDLRARFGLAPSPARPSDHLVVAQAGQRVAAIRADQVIDLVSLPASEIDGIDSITSRSGPVAGVARMPDGMVLIHDLASFLTAAEADDLDLALEQGAR